MGKQFLGKMDFLFVKITFVGRLSTKILFKYMLGSVTVFITIKDINKKLCK